MLLNEALVVKRHFNMKKHKKQLLFIALSMAISAHALPSNSGKAEKEQRKCGYEVNL